MTTLVIIGDVLAFVGGFAACWYLKDRLMSFLVKL